MTDPWKVHVDALARHWAIFPVNADKTPATTHGHLDAISAQDGTPQALAAAVVAYKRLCGDIPPWGYGIACGHSGLAVVDVDVKTHGERKFLEEHRAELPDTLTIRTPSGGCHLIYSIRAKTKRIKSGVLEHGAADLKSDGGYVVGVGSPGYEVEVDRPIARVTTRLRTFLGKRVGRQRDVLKKMDDNGLELSIRRGINVHDSFLELSARWRLRAFMTPPEMEARLLELAEAACAARPDRKLDVTVREFDRMLLGARGKAGRADEIMAEIGPPSTWAREGPAHGAEKPPQTADEIMASLGGNGVDPSPAPVEAVPEYTLPPLDWASVTSEPAPAVEWVAEPYLAEGDVSLFSAQSNMGKTLFLGALTLAITSGVAAVLGVDKVSAGKVALFTIEERQPRLQRRLQALHRRWPTVVPEHEITLVTQDSDIMRDLWLARSEDGRGEIEQNEELIAFLTERFAGYALLAFDPLVLMSRGISENSEEMAQVIQALRQVAVGTGAAIAVVHHTRKDAGSRGSNQTASRGSTAIVSTVDIALGGSLMVPPPNTPPAVAARWNDEELNPEATRWVSWAVSKGRDTERASSFCFNISAVEIDTIDKNGVKGTETAPIMSPVSRGVFLARIARFRADMEQQATVEAESTSEARLVDLTSHVPAEGSIGLTELVVALAVAPSWSMGRDARRDAIKALLPEGEKVDCGGGETLTRLRVPGHSTATSIHRAAAGK
jgi:hypothetical protein